MIRTRLATSIVVTVGVLASASARGQDAIDRLERRLAEQEAAAEELPAPAGEGEPGYLGVLADDRQDLGEGVRIVEVVEGGPAAVAGLLEGDLIVGIDARPVRSMDDLARAIEATPPSGRLLFDVLRGDGRASIDVVLGERPGPQDRLFDDFGPVPPAADGPREGQPGAPPVAPPGDAGPAAGTLGVVTQPVTEDVRQRLGLRTRRGARVVERVVGSAAERAGIPLGAVIVAVDEMDVDTPDDLAAALEGAAPGQELAVFYYANRELRKATVVLAAADAAGRGLPPAIDQRDDPLRRLEERIIALERRLERLEAALDAAEAAHDEE